MKGKKSKPLRGNSIALYMVIDGEITGGAAVNAMKRLFPAKRGNQVNPVNPV